MASECANHFMKQGDFMNFRKIISCALSVIMMSTLAAGTYTSAASHDTASVLTAQTTEITSGCAVLGLPGTYNYSELQSAIDKINAYRLEACTEGVKSPSTGKALTISDYVPIKWSYELGCIAETRAMEASVCLSHTRPNGTSCFTAASPNGITSNGECLAWNMTTSMLRGVEQWYAEKSAWVNNTGGVTEHYTQMIDPAHEYFGLSMFVNNEAYYNTTVCAEYSNSSMSDTKRISTHSGTFEFEAKLSDCEFTLDYGSFNILLGGTSKFGLNAKYNGGGGLREFNKVLSVTDGITWETSDSAIATVDSSGTVKGAAVGSATITAYISGTNVGSQNVNVTTVLMGDVNGDSAADSSDAAMILAEYARKQSSKPETFTDEQKAVADYNGDGSIDSSDSALILKAYASKQAE